MEGEGVWVGEGREGWVREGEGVWVGEREGEGRGRGGLRGVGGWVKGRGRGGLRGGGGVGEGEGERVGEGLRGGIKVADAVFTSYIYRT